MERKQGSESTPGSSDGAVDQKELGEREALQTMGLLGAGVAHEVKNQLAGVMGMVQLARRRAPGPEEIDAWLERLEQETRDCVDSLDRFLRLRHDAAPDGPHCDVAAVVRDAAALVSHTYQLHEIRLEVELEDDIPLVRVGRSLLRGVVVNLLINAMQSSGHEARVVAAVRRVHADIELTVSDNGPGVPLAVRDRIFDPLFTTRGEGKGTGLGLYLARNRLAQVGGTIEIDTNYAAGARFVVRLPAASSWDGST